jgi:hypothetical protein
MKISRHRHPLLWSEFFSALQQQLDFLLEGAAIRAGTPLERSFQFSNAADCLRLCH